MSKLRILPVLVVATLLLSGCTSSKHHIGMWIDEEGIAPDSDSDGVRDPDDRCISTPAGLIVDEFGCSSDEDQDGVLNEVDQCPETPLGTLVNMVGCSADDDFDGVLNHVDQCPNTPKGAVVNVVGCFADDDQDGVHNDTDQCPDTPLNTKVDKKGCHIDGDRDGVADHMDRCLNTPKGVKVDCDGCSAADMELPTLNGLYFDRNKATLKPEARTVLSRVVDTMERHPKLMIMVVGHTDSRGTEAHNKDLSWRRASSVVNFLVEQGISRSRLQASGEGEAKPIASNATSEGRAQNRRVEFVVLQ